MDTFQAIRSRRAIKHYDPHHTITAEEEQQLLELALQAPTAFNLQNWRLVIAREPELRTKIRKVAWDQAQVTDASLLIILCADLKAWDKDPARYWKNAPQDVQDILIPAIGQYYAGRPDAERDEAMRSCGLIGQTIMLAATAMGYDSCPMDGFDFDAVAELIQLPQDHVISFMIAIGKGVQAAWPKPGQLPLDQVVVENRFNA